MNEALRWIRWKLFMFKVSFNLMKIEQVHKFMRKNYCRYGIHKLKTGSVTHGSDRRSYTVRFIKCQFCNYIFFSNKRDMNIYIAGERRTKAAVSALFRRSLFENRDNIKSSVSDLGQSRTGQSLSPKENDKDGNVQDTTENSGREN